MYVATGKLYVNPINV